ncbi:MAG: alpha/beta hydrolase family protein [Promethearchaeota archaeon]
MNIIKIRKISILGILCLSLFIIMQLYFDGFQDQESKTINIEYFDPTLNEVIRYDRSINIIKPINSNVEKFPVVIMIHGELVDSNTMANIKLEFLHNDYMVILLDCEFGYKLIIELNTTLNYLITRTDVNSSQIGIIGHSRGAHYAFHMAWMRDDIIGAVIGLNFGSFGQIFLDYYEYYNRFINLTIDFGDFLKEFTFPISLTSPRNMFLLTNLYEPQRKTRSYYYIDELILWDEQFNEYNTYSGDFQEGTARVLEINPSFFMHLSGLLDSNAIYKQINWMNNALSIENNKNYYSWVMIRTMITILIYIMFFSSGTIFFANIIIFLPNILLSILLSTFLLLLLFSLILSSPLSIIFTLAGITISFISTITMKEKFWMVKKKYTACNFTVKNTLTLSKREEIAMKVMFIGIVITEFSFFVFIFNRPEFVYYWILFVIFIFFILPYEYQWGWRKFKDTRKERYGLLQMEKMELKNTQEKKTTQKK